MQPPLSERNQNRSMPQQTEDSNRRLYWLNRIPIYGSAIVIGIGSIVLLGWLFDLDLLQRAFFHRSTTMKANTALGFVLAGTALLLSVHPKLSQFRRLCKPLAIVVILIGSLTLIEYGFGWNLGIDELLARDNGSLIVSPYPGRIGLNSALNFTLIGTALFCLRQRSLDWLTQILALIAGLIAAQSLIGFAYGVRVSNQLSIYAPARVGYAATLFIVLAIGILYTRPDRAVMQPIMSPLVGGAVARRILPVSLLVPLVIGAIILQGWRLGYYDPAFAMSLLILSLFVITFLFIWRTSIILNNKDQQRRNSELQLQTALETLRDRETRLNQLAEANIIGILFGNTDGGIHSANDELLRIVGYTRQELEAGELRWFDITPEEWLPLDRLHIAEAQARGACTPYEKEYFRKDGSRVPVLVGFTLVGEQRQEAIAFILDLSDRKRLEDDLRRQTDELERANRLKDEFLAVLSHELRTPLNPILGWTQMLRTQRLDAAKTAQALDTIERNAKLQITLVSDLLDISRILRGKINLRNHPVDLTQVVEAAIDTVRLAAQAKSITIKFQHPDFPAIANGDRDRLQQVVWNLLSNAVKFTPNCGQVTIRLITSRTDAKLIVSDTGQGISPAFLPYVFEHFRQEDGSSTRSFGGLGLGLAIAKHLVELHGGMIGAESSGENRGATFIVELPLLAEAAPVAASIQATTIAQSKPLEGLALLVVDDDKDNLEFARFLLQTYGAIVTPALSATEALRILEAREFDVLISDMGMPEIDGYELIKRVRSRFPSLSAIALTAYASDHDRALALAAGYNHHLPKPIDAEALIQLLAPYAKKYSS